MAERPSFRRVGPEKRCKHVGAPFVLPEPAVSPGVDSRPTSGAEGSGAAGASFEDVGTSPSHLPFGLPRPFPFLPPFGAE
eukprot:8487798-Alexandrium_andersonii.AAC.1